MDTRSNVIHILEGNAFSFQFTHTKIVSMPDQETILEYDSNSYTELKFKPRFPTGTLSLDFADFNKIKSVGLFYGLNNGFDFIMQRTEWTPYVYDNYNEPDNPLYGLNYKIHQMGFDTLCLFLENNSTWLEIHCETPSHRKLCLVFSKQYVGSEDIENLFNLWSL